LAAAAALKDVAGASGRLEVRRWQASPRAFSGIVLFGLDAQRRKHASSFPSLVIEGVLPRPGMRCVAIALCWRSAVPQLGDWLDVLSG